MQHLSTESGHEQHVPYGARFASPELSNSTKVNGPQSLGETALSRMVHVVTSHIDADLAIDMAKADSGYLTPSKHLEYIRTVIESNYAVKEFIKQHPSASFDEVASTMAQASGIAGEPDSEHDKRVWHIVRTRLNGMRHELAAEAVFSAVPGLVFHAVSDEKDAEKRLALERSGVDYIIELNGQVIEVDIKANLKGAETGSLRLLQKQQGPIPKIALWSQLGWNDFDGGLTVSASLAAEKSDAMVREIYARLRKVARRRTESGEEAAAREQERRRNRRARYRHAHPEKQTQRNRARRSRKQ